MPERWKTLPDGATGLLVEFRAPTRRPRRLRCAAADAVLAGLTLLEPAQFTTDPAQAAQYWNVRSGLLASVGGARPSGTSFILEDVCFPPERLADGALDLQALFARHDYAGVIFGHASAGNLHFLITPLLNAPREVARFDAFMQDVVDLVVGKYDGSLKAEHGTGRNIAPFVEREWGAKLTALMWKLRRLADPDGILAPGVMLSNDPQHHLAYLQTAPAIEDESRPLHPMRLLRARMSESRPVDHAATADRPAARDGAAGKCVAGARCVVARLRLRRHRDLRRRRQLRTRLSGRASTPAC